MSIQSTSNHSKCQTQKNKLSHWQTTRVPAILRTPGKFMSITLVLLLVKQRLLGLLRAELLPLFHGVCTPAAEGSSEPPVWWACSSTYSHHPCWGLAVTRLHTLPSTLPEPSLYWCTVFTYDVCSNVPANLQPTWAGKLGLPLCSWLYHLHHHQPWG